MPISNQIDLPPHPHPSPHKTRPGDPARAEERALGAPDLPPHRAEERALGAPDRALVVEHDRGLQDSICFHLALESFECERAGSGGSAIAGAGARRFDVVLIDMEMPDALKVCRSLQG